MVSWEGFLSEVKECFTQNATRLSRCQNMSSQRTTFPAGTTPPTWRFASTWPTWKHAATWNIQATWTFHTNGRGRSFNDRLKQRLSPREAVKFNIVLTHQNLTQQDQVLSTANCNPFRCVIVVSSLTKLVFPWITLFRSRRRTADPFEKVNVRLAVSQISPEFTWPHPRH